MKIFCKKCMEILSNDLLHLDHEYKIENKNGERCFPVGYYTFGGGTFGKHEKWIIVNIEDVVNLINHFSKNRLNGCCGLDGLDGINKLCKNYHEVATESSDCWTLHYVAFDPTKVYLE